MKLYTIRDITAPRPVLGIIATLPKSECESFGVCALPGADFKPQRLTRAQLARHLLFWRRSCGKRSRFKIEIAMAPTAIFPILTQIKD